MALTKIIDYNRTTDEELIGEKFFLKNGDEPYILCSRNGFDYFVNLITHQIFTIDDIFDMDGFYLDNNDTDFLGVNLMIEYSCENCKYCEYSWADGEMVCKYNGNYIKDNVKCPKENYKKEKNS